MNISGIRPKQEFYAGVERREPEKKEMHRLNQVAIRMVEMPPLFSEEPMNGPAAAVKVMADTFRDYDREVVAVVNLRADMRPININIASIGALDQSIAHPREILKSTILSNAAAIILVHNHPSGRLVPSVEDIGLTDRMNKICDLIGVKLVDHIIVGPGNEFYSFQEKNQMPLASLKLTKNLEDIELEGFRVAENTFEKDAPVSLDYGLDFYAPQTTLLPDGRRVMIAWMKSWDSCVIKEKQRWQGMMTLPRELEYRDGKIWQKPVREIENYRKNRCCYENVKVGESLSLEGVRGRMIDLTVELQNADGIMDGSRNSGNPNQEALDVYNEFRIELARNEEYTTVFTYDRKRQILEIDRTWSGVQRDVVCTRKLQITDDRQNLKLRFILDRSSIELFINDGSKTATTVIPTPVEADEILFHSDGNAVIQVEKYDIVL